MTEYSLAQLTSVRSSPPELIRIAGVAGYDCVGLRLVEVTGGDAWPLVSDPQMLRETKDAMRAHGVAVLDVELVRLQPDTDLGDLKPTFEIAAELGARHVLTQAHDPVWARIVDNFGCLCELLRQFGLTTDLEFLTWTDMRGLNEALQLLRAVNRANAGLTIDTLHFFRSGCRPEDLRQVPGELLHFIQISDAPAEGPHTAEGLIFAAREERLDPGEGGLDLAGVLRELPLDIVVAVEIPNTRMATLMSDEDRASKALRATKQLVERVNLQRSTA
jgi:sugar phosphate isomerase/epimerase